MALSCAFLAAAGCTEQPTEPPVESPELQVATGFGAGKIVVNHDEWTLSNTGLSLADGANFALNVASWFAGGGTGNFLVYSNNFGLVQSNLAATMTGAGHTWNVNLSETFTLANLLQYDAIFLAGNSADNTVLIDYVNSGGNVYLAGGTGVGGAVAEAARWNTFLNAFGLQFSSPYNQVSGILPITSTHPIFAGVSALFQVDDLFQINGNSVSELNPANPDTDILEFSGVHGLYGVFSLTVIPVEIDIKPGSDPNCFNNNGHGVIPVALLSDAYFDVQNIDPGSVQLEGLPVRARGKSNKLLAHLEDVSGPDGVPDGLVDLVVQIEDIDDTFSSGDGTATVTGNLFDGRRIEGSDAICVVP